MNADQAGKAREFLEWMSEAAAALPEDKDEAMQMALTLGTAALYVAQFELEMLKGADPYDALTATARGERKINLTPSQQTVLRLLMARPGQG